MIKYINNLFFIEINTCVKTRVQELFVETIELTWNVFVVKTRENIVHIF